MKPGDYYRRSGWRSRNHPLGDGLHMCIGFAPTEFTMTEVKTFLMCGSKHTATARCCYGGNKSLQPWAGPARNVNHAVTAWSVLPGAVLAVPRR